MTIDDQPRHEIDPQVDVDDDEYVRRRRLKALNNARERVISAEGKAWQACYLKGLSEQQAEEMIVTAVRAFLREARMVIQKLEAAEMLMDDLGLGAVHFRPPDGLGSVETRPEIKSVHGLTGFERDDFEIKFYGLQSVLRSQSSFKITWQIEKESMRQLSKTETKTTSHAFPSDAALRAFDFTIQALDEAGLNFDPHTERDEYEGGYADLLDGVDNHRTNGT